MTEDIYGMLKRWFPITKFIRSHLLNSIRIVQACIVLHNIALDYRDEVPTINHPNYREEVEEEDDQRNYDEIPPRQVHLVNNLNPRQRREQGMATRDNWRLSMDNTPTRKEVVKMANHLVQAEVCRCARR